jgi:hypothetical protein
MLRLSWKRLGSGGPPRAHWIEEMAPGATPSLVEVEGREERERGWFPNRGLVALGGLLFVAGLLMTCSGTQLQAKALPDESPQAMTSVFP